MNIYHVIAENDVDHRDTVVEAATAKDAMAKVHLKADVGLVQWSITQLPGTVDYPRWIVMTSRARMPNSVQARYNNIALVKITEEYAATNQRPKMISTRAQGVEIVRHLGHWHVGKTSRSAFQKAMAAAEAQAIELNAAKE